MEGQGLTPAVLESLLEACSEQLRRWRWTLTAPTGTEDEGGDLPPDVAPLRVMQHIALPFVRRVEEEIARSRREFEERKKGRRPSDHKDFETALREEARGKLLEIIEDTKTTTRDATRTMLLVMSHTLGGDVLEEVISKISLDNEGRASDLLVAPSTPTRQLSGKAQLKKPKGKVFARSGSLTSLEDIMSEVDQKKDGAVSTFTAKPKLAPPSPMFKPKKMESPAKDKAPPAASSGKGRKPSNALSPPTSPTSPSSPPLLGDAPLSHHPSPPEEHRTTMPVCVLPGSSSFVVATASPSDLGGADSLPRRSPATSFDEASRAPSPSRHSIRSIGALGSIGNVTTHASSVDAAMGLGTEDHTWNIGRHPHPLSGPASPECLPGLCGASSSGVPSHPLQIVRQYLSEFQAKGGMPKKKKADVGLAMLSVIDAVKSVVKKEHEEHGFIRDVSYPAYVFGDVHGCFRDVMLYSKMFWSAGIESTPSNYIFLGDYADKGPSQVESIMFLFMQKLLAPTQLMLMRGNHDCRDVNIASFAHQCIEYHPLLWQKINAVFMFLPLIVTIGGSVMCMHAGIPRCSAAKAKDILERYKGRALYMENRIIQNVEYDSITELDILAMDIMWSDPYEPGCTRNTFDAYGFADNDDRGAGCFFNEDALNRWLSEYPGPDGGDEPITCLIRGHQMYTGRGDLVYGVWPLMNDKILTVHGSLDSDAVGWVLVRSKSDIQCFVHHFTAKPTLLDKLMKMVKL